MAMYELGKVIEDRRALFRDASFDRTDFVHARTGRVLSFAATPSYLEAALASQSVAALVVPPALAERVPDGIGVAVDDDPEMAFWRLHNRLAQHHGMRAAVEPFVHPTARIHSDAHVESGCRIGADVVVEARAVIHAGTVLEDGVHVRSEAIVGCEGTMCKRRAGMVLQIAHAGTVHVGEGAQIFTRVIVQRAVFARATPIGTRAVLGTDCIISHDTSVGEDATIGFRAVVAGFSRIGNRAWIGPNATVSNLLEIGDDARLEIGAVAVRSISTGARYSGLFARSHATMRRMSLILAELARRDATL